MNAVSCSIKSLVVFIGSFLFLVSCATHQIKQKQTLKQLTHLEQSKESLVITFGSCNDQNLSSNLWDEIKNENPSVFIWTGDAIYPKTFDIKGLKEAYTKQKNDAGYQSLIKNTSILGVYDDHDYGLNDGGIENPIKDSAKLLFSAFIDLELTDELKQRDGLYYSVGFDKYATKLIVLDTRYNRTELQKSNHPNKRYEPKLDGEILGENQWRFLESALDNSKYNNIIIVSSIQFLNTSHSYEKWGNISSERDKLLNLLKQNAEKNFYILSGDRHFGEVSKYNEIIEVTSSGLNKVYTKANEPNPLRASELIIQPNFAKIVISLNGEISSISLIGKENKVLYEE